MNLTQIRDAVIERDKACVARSQLPGPCWGRLFPHHIINRGMGGSKLHDGPEWKIAMCEGHNGRMESDPETASLAREFGMKVARNGVIPEFARVHYPDGWFRLTGTERIAT